MLPKIDNCKISIIGLGYVGLPLAIEFAKTKICKRTGRKIKRNIFGLDIDKNRISDLENGIDCTLELSESEKLFLKEIKFTTDSNIIEDSDVFIVTVPTPIDGSKKPILKPLIKASIMIGKCLKNYYINELHSKKPIIIFESTVYPGATEEVCIPLIEEYSNLIANKDFFYGYSPERINPGDKNKRLSQIVKVTSGSNERVSICIDNLYGSIIEAGTFPVSSVKTAEAAKIIENTQRDLNIALVNELAHIFEKIGVDTNEVIEAASTKWNFMKLFPGLVGGHCIGVDPYYLTYKSKQVGYNAKIILAGREINDSMGKYVADLLVKKMLQKFITIKNANILVMGFSFKENCPDIRNTGVINAVNELKKNGCKVDVYDPWVNRDQVLNLYEINVLNNIPHDKYSAVFIAVGHNCFYELGIEGILKFCKEDYIIFDFKYLFDADERLERI